MHANSELFLEPLVPTTATRALFFTSKLYQLIKPLQLFYDDLFLVKVAKVDAME
jgi:hypothetical protein